MCYLPPFPSLPNHLSKSTNHRCHSGGSVQSQYRCYRVDTSSNPRIMEPHRNRMEEESRHSRCSLVHEARQTLAQFRNNSKTFTTSGDIISCRPLECIHSSPYPLPILPAQVFIVTVASETMATTNG